MDPDGHFGYPDSDGLYDFHDVDVAPDIWVGRLTVSPLTFRGAPETGLLENYFRKKHLYRSGLAPLPGRRRGGRRVGEERKATQVADGDLRSTLSPASLVRS